LPQYDAPRRHVIGPRGEDHQYQSDGVRDSEKINHYFEGKRPPDRFNELRIL
jgi:hypothetical protein